MEARRRELLPPVAVSLACVFLFGLLGTLTPAFTDYEIEAEQSLQALRAGEWAEFLERAPAYGGSLVLRAPFAFLPDLWGGGDHALFRAMAVPCLVACALLAVALWRRARSLGRPPLTAWIALAIVAANPLTLRALEIGHPEELLGAVLCVAAALAAGRDRAVPAGVLLGLAVANKPWAVLAVVPVLAIQRTGCRRLLAAAVCACGVVMLPLALAGGGAVEQAAAVARNAGTIFQPWQVWWFLGEPGLVMGTFGEKPGYRVPPDWLTGAAHPILVLVPAAVSAALLPRLRRQAWHDGLLLLAFALLLRCVLDPWNVSYYSIPFLFALVAWEIHARARPPVISLGATLLSWVTLAWLQGRVHPDVEAVAYIAWTVPLMAWMGTTLVAPRRGSAQQPVRPRAALSEPA